ncbi:hypothetical protein CWI38_0393p0020 [Hamiltosporidium tvaerminnensis]|uniref:Leucine-rich repeat-containing protein n=1 Tax=Hamiltosporidium tvaerminnensis TaxID=1176355 RepID=A0A4V2JXX8_9MICR|nr:hypothetical protein CWI38_0393p0020 [Hamiltosporidium tvaerminnensis]
MYFLLFLKTIRSSYKYYDRNMNGVEYMRKPRSLKESWVGLLYVLSLGFLDIVNCASKSKNGNIIFGLLDLNWETGISKSELSKVKYWLSRSSESEQLGFCSGKHRFKCNNVSMPNLVCSLKISYQNHKPLRSFEVNYKEDWKVQFRVLNRFLLKDLDKLFLFNISMDVNCQEFEMFVKSVTFDPGFAVLNIGYGLFYRFLRLFDALDPISSIYLSKFYSDLLRKCLMGISSIDIMADPEHYRVRYFGDKNRYRLFMPFFSVISDSIDACFNPETSYLSLFKRTKHSTDQCFRYAINVSRLILKISISSLELLLSGFKSNEWSVFNWILSVTKISGFCIDDTEVTCSEMKILGVCDILNPETTIRSAVPSKTIPLGFFSFLADTNVKSIQYLKFVNVVPPFDYLDQNINKASVSYFEVAYSSIEECNRITALLQKMWEPNAFKLTGYKMNSDDINRILYSNIKILVLKECTLDVDTDWKPIRDRRGEFKLIGSLKQLNISSSIFPVCLVQLFLMSAKLENIYLNSLKFTACLSFDPFSNTKRNLDCLEADEYIPNECLNTFFTGEISVNSLYLRGTADFESVRFIFESVNLHKSVKYLNLSKNSLTVEHLNLIANFYCLKRLSLSRSLPSSMEGLIHSKIFENITHLDISHNDIFSQNSVYIIWFTNLKALDMSSVRIGCYILSSILSEKLKNSLSYLDISGVDLSLADFKCISDCRNLRNLIFSYGNSCPLTTYSDVLKTAYVREKLSILRIETTGDIDIDDVLSLADFADLSGVKITCRTIINERKRELVVFNFKNPEFRIQFVLKIYFVDKFIEEIFNNLFKLCYCSFTYEKFLPCINFSDY